MYELKKWYEIPIGSIVPEAGSSMINNTGSWRMLRPVLNTEKCTNCLICWISVQTIVFPSTESKDLKQILHIAKDVEFVPLNVLTMR